MQIFTEGSDAVPKDYVKAMQYFERAADQVRVYDINSRLFSWDANFHCSLG